MHRSARWIVTGVRDGKVAREVVSGIEVGHGARVEVPPGSLLLVLDKRPAGRKRTRDGSPYTAYDAKLTLLLVLETGVRAKPLWQREFASEKGAFGAAGTAQLRKHLAAYPPSAGLSVRKLDPGPGRPNWAAGPCRWCEKPVPKGGGLAVGHGKEALVEHRPGFCPRPATTATGQTCAACGIRCVQGSAEWAQVRDPEAGGRWEARHRGACDRWPSPEEDERRREELRVERERQEEAKRKQEAKRQAARAARAAERRAVEEEEIRAAQAVRERVKRLGVTGTVDVAQPYDKGLDGSGTRMRLVERRLTLDDGSTATVYDVETYGGMRGTLYEDGEYEPDDRGGRFYRLPDAREEYQRHKWEPAPYVPSRRPRFESLPCPDDPSVRHCGHCGTTTSVGGWMTANLGLACDTDCYDAMSDKRGAHDRRYHRA
ncbi:hypothetical protein [Streptomyces cinereoruber]